MKKVESTSVQYLILQIVAISVAGMILWPLLDLFWCAVISHTEFIYSVPDHIVDPIIFGFMMGTIIWVLEKRKVKLQNQ